MYHPIALKYQENRIKNASPMELILILYEGAIKQLLEAEKAIEKKQIENKTQALNKCSLFISELNASLDRKKGGQIATSLARLYRYFQHRLLEANTKNDIKIIKEIIEHLRSLHEAWSGIMKKTPNTNLTSDKVHETSEQRLNISF